MLDVFTQRIEDTNTRDVIEDLIEALTSDPFRKGTWQFIEINVPAAVTNQAYAHQLSFKPLDVIHTHNSTGATVTFNHSRFTDSSINITTSAATKIRAFIGTYNEDN